MWKKPAELVGVQEVDDILAQVPEEVPVTTKEEIKTETVNGETKDATTTNGGKREGNDHADGNSAKRLKYE